MNKRKIIKRLIWLRKRKNLIFIGAFTAVMVLPWVLWGLFAIFNPSFVNASSTDNENRDLANIEWASLWTSGDSISDFVDDRVPFRSYLISFYNNINDSLEEKYLLAVNAIMSDVTASADESETTAEDQTAVVIDENDEAIEEATTEEVDPSTTLDIDLPETLVGECANGHLGTLVDSCEPSYTTYGYDQYQCQRCGVVYRTNRQEKLVDTSYFMPLDLGEGVVQGRYDWLFFTDENSLEDYQGSNILDDEYLATAAERVQLLKDRCDELGKEVVLMFVPNKEQVYSEYMPSYEVYTTYKRTQMLADYLDENTTMNVIYPIDELKEISYYWQSYCKYDTHWNHVGGYAGTMAMYEALGMETTNARFLTGEYSERNVNDLVNLAGLDQSSLPQDYDYTLNYHMDITVEGLDYEADVIHTTADCENQQSFCMIGDSFRRYMLDYFTKDFANCTVAHRDSIDEVTSDIKNADVIVIEIIERYDTEGIKVVNQIYNRLQ